MTDELETDITKLSDGDRVTLYPNEFNKLHTKPVEVTYQSGYFYSENPVEPGPDYYWRDVLEYNHGWTRKDQL